MRDLYWLTDNQMAPLQPYFPRSHGEPRVYDRRVLSGIVFVNRKGLRWCYAPLEYGLHKTLHNGWTQWGERGVFLRMMERAVPRTNSKGSALRTGGCAANAAREFYRMVTAAKHPTDRTT